MAKIAAPLLLQIMKVYKVAPFDQRLSLDGVCFERTDMDKTLSQLNIYPDSVLRLVVRACLFTSRSRESAVRCCGHLIFILIRGSAPVNLYAAALIANVMSGVEQIASGRVDASGVLVL